MSAPFDKNDLFLPPKRITTQNLQENREIRGRIDLEIGEQLLECFLARSDTKRLFIFLAAAGRNTPGTHFDRVSWHPHLNGNCLYIEDPMYKHFPKLTGGWYYGTKDFTYLHTVATAIQAIADALSIRNTDIIFIGSSASGYASLYLADIIPGCVALAYNPQIRLKDWPYARTFSKIVGIDLETQDRFGRNCLRRITSNALSKFFIICNAASDLDFKKQVKPWMDELGHTLHLGLNSINNVHILLHNTPSLTPHHTFLNLQDTIVLLTLLLNNEEPDAVAAVAFHKTASENIILSEKNFFLKLWGELLHKDIPAELIPPPYCSTRHCKLSIRGLPKSWNYGIILETSRKAAVISLRLEDSLIGRSTQAESLFMTMAQNSKYNLLIKERLHGRHLEIHSSKIPLTQLKQHLINFVQATVQETIAIHNQLIENRA